MTGCWIPLRFSGLMNLLFKPIRFPAATVPSRVRPLPKTLMNKSPCRGTTVGPKPKRRSHGINSPVVYTRYFQTDAEQSGPPAAEQL